MVKIVTHKADSRGLANHGWLISRHTFSFAEYFNPERMNFGALRVLNDDFVAEGMGFGTHSHKNMEIISIPLEGDLEHKDNLGNTTTIKTGDIQVLSAGTGVTHSEYNKNKDKPVKFLQIWVTPKKENLEPRYDQVTLDLNDRHNKLQQIVSPNPDSEGVWVYQDTWFSIGKFDKGFSTSYVLNRATNGLYVFILRGELTVEGVPLSEKDGLGMYEVSQVQIFANTQDAEVLLIEVPLK